MNRLIKAFKYSSAGLKSCFKNEPAFRLEVYLLIIAIPLAVLVGDNPMECILLVGSILLIMMTELLNSAIENVNDRIGKEYSDLCKMAKDQSSAAVFVSIVLAIVAWGLIILENFM